MLQNLSRPLIVIAIVLLLMLTAGLWWRLPAGRRASWSAPHPAPRDVLVSTDGRTLLTEDRQGLTLWDVPGGRERARLPLEPRSGPLDSFAMLAPDGRK